ETMDRLVAYHWPGNVRELENARAGGAAREGASATLGGARPAALTLRRAGDGPRHPRGDPAGSPELEADGGRGARLRGRPTSPRRVRPRHAPQSDGAPLSPACARTGGRHPLRGGPPSRDYPPLLSISPPQACRRRARRLTKIVTRQILS